MINGTGLIAPAAEMPVAGMKVLVSAKNGMLTIEFERSINWLQFNSYDAKCFVNGLIAHIQAMDAN